MVTSHISMHNEHAFDVDHHHSLTSLCAMVSIAVMIASLHFVLTPISTVKVSRLKVWETGGDQGRPLMRNRCTVFASKAKLRGKNNCAGGSH